MIALVALVVSQTAPTPIQVPPAPPPILVARSPTIISAARKAGGLEIARRLNSVASVDLMMTRMIDKDLPATFLKAPGIAEIEQENPGFVKAIVTAIEPLMRSSLTAELPTLWNTLGALYAETLNEQEIDAALAFYASPTGVWLLDQISKGMDFGPMLQGYVRDPDLKIGADDVKKLLGTSVDEVRAGMTPERSAAIMAFARTSAGRKVIALQPQIFKLAADWSNRPDPALDAQVEKLTEEAAAAFLAKAKRSKK